jgi:hypothetical protein
VDRIRSEINTNRERYDHSNVLSNGNHSFLIARRNLGGVLNILDLTRFGLTRRLICQELLEGRIVVKEVILSPSQGSWAMMGVPMSVTLSKTDVPFFRHRSLTGFDDALGGNRVIDAR